MFYVPPYTPQTTKDSTSTKQQKDTAASSGTSARDTNSHKQPMGGTQQFFSSSLNYSQIQQAPEQHQDEVTNNSKSRCLML